MTPPAGLLHAVGHPPLAGVLPDVAAALGHPIAGRATASLDLPRAERVVVVLVDGLGWEALSARTGHAPTLRGLIRGGTPLAAGYPSTTAASLASFGTGLTPGQTGLLGYTVRDPQHTRPTDLVNLVSWTTSAGRPLDPQAWQPHQSVFEHLTARGVPVTSTGPGRFAGSGLTLAALRGGEFRGSNTPQDRVDAIAGAIPRGGLGYLYWGEVDKVGHHHGWTSHEWSEALGDVDAAIARLMRRLPSGTLVIITADHGMVDVTRTLDVAAIPALAGSSVVVAGEPRACHVHLREGVDLATAAATWREVLGEDAWVLTRTDAIEHGLFGVVEERNRPLIGDLVVAMTGTVALADSRTQTAASLALIGMHGSLTPAEVYVPGIVEVV